jgi:ABC-2 type transport system permease protein
VKRVEDLPYSLSGIFLIEGDKRDSAIYERAFARVFDVYDRQSSLYTAQAVVAPLLAIQTLSMALAGTDVHEQRHFLEAVGEYRKDWLRVLNEDVLVHQKRGQVVYTRGRDLWESRLPNSSTGRLAWVGCWEDRS